MSYSAHTDTFALDNLPPRRLWPEFRFELSELKYPARMNCATELLDKMVSRGFGHRTLIHAADGRCTYTELYAQANRIANVLVRDMGLKPGNRVLLRGPNNPMMAACWFAVMKAGAVCVATMPLLRAKELTEIIEKAQVTHALCDRRLDAELKAAQEKCSFSTTASCGASAVSAGTVAPRPFGYCSEISIGMPSRSAARIRMLAQRITPSESLTAGASRSWTSTTSRQDRAADSSMAGNLRGRTQASAAATYPIRGRGQSRQPPPSESSRRSPRSGMPTPARSASPCRALGRRSPARLLSERCSPGGSRAR